MISFPYLRSRDLSPGMFARPNGPFFLKPADYQIIDGDTLRVLAPRSADAEAGTRREEAFRIRLFSVNTPEKPIVRATDDALKRVGIDPHAGNAGLLAREAVRKICKGRALFIEPARSCADTPGADLTDRYGRLLAHICISGQPGPLFNLEGAFGLEHHLLSEGLALPLKDKTIPPAVPELVWQMRRERDAEMLPGPTPQFN